MLGGAARSRWSPNLAGSLISASAAAVGALRLANFRVAVQDERYSNSNAICSLNGKPMRRCRHRRRLQLAAERFGSNAVNACGLEGVYSIGRTVISADSDLAKTVLVWAKA